MAPGSLQTENLGFQRNKSISRPYPLRNSTARNCAVNMEVTKDVDAIEKVDVGKSVNGDSENNPTLDSNFNKNIIKGRHDGSEDNSERNSWNSESNLRTQIRNLKSLSLLHLDVIDQQQRQLNAREKELSKVRSEKYTLEQRLERMQRRTSLAERAVRGNNQSSVEKPLEPSGQVKRKAESGTQSLPSKRNQVTGRDGTTSRQGKLHQESSREKKRQKQQRKEDVHRKEKVKTREDAIKEEGEKMRNEKCSEAKGDREGKKKVVRLEDRFLFTDILYPTLQDLRVELSDLHEPASRSNVEVPSWRTPHTTSSSHSPDEPEDTTDEVYDRRHSKMELEEKKRKRWDAQRIRELRTIERMEWKAIQKEMAKWAHIVTTYSPEPSDTKRVAVSDTIPVVAFGALVPRLKNGGFSLPWFDIAEREKDEMRRQTRSRACKK